MAGKKKNPYAKYAFIGLILALLACITTGLLASTNVLTGIGMFTLEETQQNVVDIVLQVSIGLLFVGLGMYAFLAPDTIRRIFTGRQARYGSNSLILTVAFIGILVAVNYIVYNNQDLFGAPWDFTADQSNTLAPETLQVLATLPEKVTATGFYSTSLNSDSAQELLQKFKDNSDGKFDYTFVNPDLNPMAARDAGITGDGKILLQMGETKEVASFASETELVRTMIRLISPEARVIYFLQGHGEISLEAGADLSYSVAKSTLEAKNYTVNSLNLLTTRDIPEDALAIVVAGPAKPVSKDEVALLKEYVDNGGSLVVMQDPVFFTEFGDAADPLAEYLTADWGITLNNDVVIDPVNSQNPFQAVSSLYNSGHPITQNLTSNLFVVLPQARSLAITGEKENVTQTWLISTIETAWGETDLVNEVVNNPEVDTQGPLYLAVVGENSTTTGRVVVFGNSLFAVDGNFEVYGNGNMFVNSVDWAAEQEDLLNITTRPQTQRVLQPITNLRFITIILMTVIVLPGLVVFLGISSWISRRKRG
ncbi:MAG TPA: Gldg family protein [Anaerolineales bacterium]|nr:Gldg family protein [Anaerolineales bacterium]